MFHQLQTDIRDTRQLVASHIVVDGDVERVTITQIQFLDFSRNRSRCDTHPADRLSLLVEDMNLNSIWIDVTRRVSLVTDYQTKVAIGKTMVDAKAQIDIHVTTLLARNGKADGVISSPPVVIDWLKMVIDARITTTGQ